MAAPRIRLVHWKAEEVPERAARLEAEGYAVALRQSKALRGIRSSSSAGRRRSWRGSGPSFLTPPTPSGTGSVLR